MPRITNWTQENIQIFRDNSIYIFLVLFLFILQNSQGQSLSPLHIADSLITELGTYELGSKAQQDAIDSLDVTLFRLLKNSRDSSMEVKGILLKHIRDLTNKKGPFANLRPKFIDNTRLEIIQERLIAYQDSITQIQNQLIDILEDSTFEGSKEKAVFTLATIHKEEVVEYLLKNEPKLRFTVPDYDSDFYVDETRTAMRAILEEYYRGRELSFLPLPYILKYVGDEKNASEVVLIYQHSRYRETPKEYNRLDLLIRFMAANAKSSLREIIEFEFRNFKND